VDVPVAVGELVADCSALPSMSPVHHICGFVMACEDVTSGDWGTVKVLWKFWLVMMHYLSC
jgi:hypothetical protein